MKSGRESGLSEDPGPHDVFFSWVRWDGGWATQDGRRRRRRVRGGQILAYSKILEYSKIFEYSKIWPPGPDDDDHPG